MKISTTIIILLLLTSISGPLIACDCREPRTVEEEVKNADAVIVGTIISKHIVTLTDAAFTNKHPSDTTIRYTPMSNLMIASYELLVQELYKGKITNDTLEIYTGIGGGDCGIRFEVGEKYIIYGKKVSYYNRENYNFEFPEGKNIFWTHLCFRTTNYSQDEITEIEKYSKKKNIGKSMMIFADPDMPPTFKEGGEIGLQNFIRENLKYPNTGESVTGRVYVGFTVDTLGNVKDIEIKRGITPATDEEAIRVVKMLTFNPGTREGQPIETKMVLPISFMFE
jgi:TonB family protein